MLKCVKSGHIKKYYNLHKQEQRTTSIIRRLRQNTIAIISDERSNGDVVTLVCATEQCNHIIDLDIGWVVDSTILILG